MYTVSFVSIIIGFPFST